MGRGHDSSANRVAQKKMHAFEWQVSHSLPSSSDAYQVSRNDYSVSALPSCCTATYTLIDVIAHVSFEDSILCLQRPPMAGQPPFSSRLIHPSTFFWTPSGGLWTQKIAPIESPDLMRNGNICWFSLVGFKENYWTYFQGI